MQGPAGNGTVAALEVQLPLAYGMRTMYMEMRFILGLIEKELQGGCPE